MGVGGPGRCRLWRWLLLDKRYEARNVVFCGWCGMDIDLYRKTKPVSIFALEIYTVINVEATISHAMSGVLPVVPNREANLVQTHLAL